MKIDYELKNIHFKMKELVVESGIQPAQYDFPLKKLDKQSEEYKEELLLWFKDFKDKEYKAVKDTVDQFSGWKNYKELGIYHLPEQALLRKRQKALRIAWFKWPRPPKKEQKNAKNLQELPSSESK